MHEKTTWIEIGNHGCSIEEQVSVLYYGSDQRSPEFTRALERILSRLSRPLSLNFLNIFGHFSYIFTSNLTVKWNDRFEHVLTELYYGAATNFWTCGRRFQVHFKHTTCIFMITSMGSLPTPGTERIEILQYVSYSQNKLSLQSHRSTSERAREASQNT